MAKNKKASSAANRAPAPAKKAFAPVEQKKPLVMRIIVLALVAVLVLGLIIGTVASSLVG